MRGIVLMALLGGLMVGCGAPRPGPPSQYEAYVRQEIRSYCLTCKGEHHPDCNALNYRQFASPDEAFAFFCGAYRAR